MTNRLADQPSLYLRQHADNPVDWYPWGDEALTRAREEDRPILLSVGYSSCHWCHVMAHESFENPEIAAQMNADFVCVKVDREERPDVDALYMQATIAMAGHGGWPMTVFLTPEGAPFFAGTYFPPTSVQGRPGFPDVLRHVIEAYRNRREDVVATAARVAESLQAAAAQPADGVIERTIVDEAVTGLALNFDADNGGFGGAPKFPPHVVLDFLLRRVWQRPDDVHSARMVDQTLMAMADGGIHDQVGGGFHRYSVDRIWLVPHFEKMLYDNALFAGIYALAYRVSGEARWRQVAERTLDYLMREMRLPGGGFAAAQDADSPGGEGAYFVWTLDQLSETLTQQEAQAIVLRYGVQPDGNFEGANILHVAAPMEYVAQAVGPDAPLIVTAALTKLRTARARRPAPARDDKLVTAWNGLAIQAFAEAAVAFARPELAAVAAATADVVLERLMVDGRLRRMWSQGAAHHLACLDDYANMVIALIALYDATFETRWLTLATELADDALRLFRDDADTFTYAGRDAPALIAPTRDLEDHPTPSASSQLALGLLRLQDRTGEQRFGEPARRALAQVADPARRYPMGFGTALTGIDLLTAPLRRQVAIAVPVGADPGPLVAAARAGGPHVAVVVGAPDTPGLALLHQRPALEDLPTAYVCANATCSAPVTAVEALNELLSADSGAQA